MRGKFYLRFALATVLVGFVLAWASDVLAQAGPAPLPSALNQQRPPKAKVSAASVQPAPVIAPPVPSVPQQPLSLLQEPAQRAQVRLNSEGLFIQANNASLSQILRDVSSNSGMKLEGLGRDERVFGNYGPGAAPEVLGQLLEGTGYNVLMVGVTAQGAPRELVLTPRNSSHGPATASPTPVRRADEEEDTEPEPEPPPPPIQRPMPETQQQGQQNPNGVKTPQQLLEELRRMREQNPNQNQQPEPQGQAPQ